MSPLASKPPSWAGAIERGGAKAEAGQAVGVDSFAAPLRAGGPRERQSRLGRAPRVLV